MAKHARLGASKSKQWLACPPSIALEESLQKPEAPSQYALEGTTAHALAEAKLKAAEGQITSGQLAKITVELAPDVEMDRLTTNYVEFVQERAAAMQAETGEALLIVEQRLPFDHIVPEGFGTGDAVIIGDGRLELIDLKYGRGIPVSVEDNPQLRLYALGAIRRFYPIYDFNEVTMTIYQPRLGEPSSETMPVKELTRWGEQYVKPRAELAYSGQGEFAAGSHCRFCRAVNICRARAEEALASCREDFALPPILSDDEIAELLPRLASIEQWAKDLQDYALQQALDGHHWIGYKVVEGRSNRIYKDPDATANVLLGLGLKQDQIYTTKLKGITELERTIGRKTFKEHITDAGLLIKPQGRPTLVPESDKRLPWHSAEADFND